MDSVHIKAEHLTTHGVIVGMTGSGKTGLGVVLLEEVLQQNIPIIAIDPKGDLSNLALAFAELSPDAFEPWVEDPSQAQPTAELWANGHASWGIDENHRKSYANKLQVSVFTPGNNQARPCNILGDLKATAENLAIQDEEIQSWVSGLLALIDLQADPLADREHILLSEIIRRQWAAAPGTAFDLESVIRQIPQPPFRRLGAFELEQFYPQTERMKLAMKLNGLLASSRFAHWIAGEPLDIATMLEPNTPKATVFSIAHLNDSERQFFVTTLLGKIISWMRQQPGTPHLRALIYMDEVFGFVPPVAMPPSKIPILTILKQARAHGLGMVLATQNPVDLDYRSLSNAGLWCLGKLQTERDQQRVMDGLKTLQDGPNATEISQTLAGLKKRQFLIHSTKDPQKKILHTRWALSYLRGPMTLADLTKLDSTRLQIEKTKDQATTPTPVTAESSAPSTATRRPHTELRETWLHPAAPWGQHIGARPYGKVWRPALVLKYSLRFDERKAKLDYVQSWESVYPDWTEHTQAHEGVPVHIEQDDLVTQPPEQQAYAFEEAPLSAPKWLATFEKDVLASVYQNQHLELWFNPALKMYSLPQESKEGFIARCNHKAEEAFEEEASGLRDSFAKKLERLETRLQTAEQKVEQITADIQSRKSYEMLAGAGALLSLFLGSKRSTRSLARSASSKIGGIASRRSTTQRAQHRKDAAEDKVFDLQEDIEELQYDLEEKLVDLDQAWDKKAQYIESFKVPLEKNDIQHIETYLCWYPT